MGQGVVQTDRPEETPMKLTLLAAGLALVAGTTAGCGAGAPTDASEQDFCANFEGIQKDLEELGADAKDEDVVNAIKEAGDRLEETGTPDGISEEARKGFEVTVQLIEELADDATTDEISDLDKELSEDEQKQSEAFDAYVEETCAS
jgi:hypothetical protein